ncbi:Sugar fermentation stimulation protein A [compost metagenome]
MAEAVKTGYAGHILFLVQMRGMSHFEPNEAMDPAFARALRQAAQAGVKILAYDAVVEPDSMILGGPLPVRLG